MKHDCVEVYLGRVGEVEELEEEVSHLKAQIKTLRDFLMTNFGGELGLVRDPHWDDVHFEYPVEAAVRLLTELRERRRQVETLAADLVDATTMIDHGRRRI